MCFLIVTEYRMTEDKCSKHIREELTITHYQSGHLECALYIVGYKLLSHRFKNGGATLPWSVCNNLQDKTAS